MHSNFINIFDFKTIRDKKYISDISKLIQNLKSLEHELHNVIKTNKDAYDIDCAKNNRKYIYSESQLINVLYKTIVIPKDLIDIICSYSYQVKLDICNIKECDDSDHYHVHNDYIYGITMNYIIVKSYYNNIFDKICKITNFYKSKTSLQRRYYVLHNDTYLRFYKIYNHGRGNNTFKIDIIYLATINITTHIITQNKSLTKISYVINSEFVHTFSM